MFDQRIRVREPKNPSTFGLALNADQRLGERSLTRLLAPLYATSRCRPRATGLMSQTGRA